MNVKMIVKKLERLCKPYLSLPHLWVLLVTSILAFAMCFMSIQCIDTNSFLSSIFSNIFAGLLTGVIVCLISAIKAGSLYRTECLITWLNNLHDSCLIFMDMHRKIIFHTGSDFNDDKDLYNYIYDTLCCGNDICSTIIQGQFDRALPVNTCKYCKRELAFNVEVISKSNDTLREQIISLDVSQLSKNDLRVLFQKMHEQISSLNGHIISKLKELRAKEKAIHISLG